ncbi:MAG: efflux RND transporter periplasmic adaptor subunit, partial [Candidatus Cloacimonetes bacterium]|nr:efflux RND transporter periplasmic adaptor subunit [Candidatus Cloacimonadota bacterium]
EQANKAYDNSRFVAPVAGYIADLPVSIGEMLNMGMPICSIVNSNKLKIKTGVGEMNIMKLKKDQEVIIQSDQFDRTFVGRISGIGIRPLQNSAMYPVEIELDNSKNILLPGMAVKIRILSNVYQDIIYTSQNNLVRQYDNTYVFVVDEDNKAVRKQVFTGPEVGEDIIITSGLEFGEKLVIEGMENLDAGSAVEIRQSVD